MIMLLGAALGWRLTRGVGLSQPGGTEHGKLLIAVATHVNELTRPIRHEAEYDTYDYKAHRRKTAKHKTLQPSLLDQLRQHLTGTASDTAGHSRTYGSRLPIDANALDVLATIAAQADGWVRELDLRPRATVEGNLRALVGAAGACEPGRLRMLGSDVRRWHSWARTATDWQAPPWRPHSACPVCDRRGTLRIRLDTRTGLCSACHAAWDPTAIGVLAEHVRQAGEGANGAVV